MDRVPNVQAGAGPIKIAFVQGAWHADIVNQGRDAFILEMSRNNVPCNAISVFELPGAFEIPLYAKKLAQGKGLIIPDDARTNSVAMSAWIDANRDKNRRKLNRKTP